MSDSEGSASDVTAPAQDDDVVFSDGNEEDNSGLGSINAFSSGSSARDLQQFDDTGPSIDDLIANLTNNQEITERSLGEINVEYEEYEEDEPQAKPEVKETSSKVSGQNVAELPNAPKQKEESQVIDEPQPRPEVKKTPTQTSGQIVAELPNAPKQKEESQLIDEHHTLEIYSDGYILDESELNSFDNPESQEFVNKVKKRDLSISKKGIRLIYHVTKNNFPAAERFDRKQIEYYYQIDEYDDFLTINNLRKKHINTPQYRTFLGDLLTKKIPFELLHKGYKTTIRRVTHKKELPPTFTTIYFSGFHFKKAYKYPIGCRIDVIDLKPIPPVEYGKRYDKKYSMPDLSEVPKIPVEIPEKAPFNPYNPLAWFDDNNFAFPENLQDFLACFNPNEVLNLRSQITYGHAHFLLAQLGVNLKKIDYDSFNYYSNRSLFIIINTYKNENLKLGSGPICDAIITASYYRQQNYDVYFLRDPKPIDFANWLQKMIHFTFEKLTIYYSGRRSETFDYDEKVFTAHNEVMLFDDGFVFDEDLRTILKRNPKGRKCKILLITDLYESGSIWYFPKVTKKADIEYFSDIVSISNINQDLGHVISSSEIPYHGLITFYLFAYARFTGSLVPLDVKLYLDEFLYPFKQHFNVLATQDKLLTISAVPNPST